MRKFEFDLPKNAVYLCGHSLGPMPKQAQATLQYAIQSWADEGVKAWNQAQWINLPMQVGGKIAALIGAQSDEVVISDSTSINLFKVLNSAIQMQGNRKTILTTKDNFPADLYVAQGVSTLYSDIHVKVVDFDQLIENLNDRVSVLLLTHVNYRDAAVHDISMLTEIAHRFGILVVLDLSHSVGIMPIHLNNDQVDFAVGCTYKYLNGGPGAPAFVYVNQRHHCRVHNPIYGWMGHKNPFDFSPTYESEGILKYLGGTPYIFSLKALDGALSVLEELPLAELYAKTQEHSAYLLEKLEKIGLKVISPKHTSRGGHVAFIHEQGHAICQALGDTGVIGDYREPGLVRLCVNPLYLCLSDIAHSIDVLDTIIQKQIYLNPRYQIREKVT